MGFGVLMEHWLAGPLRDWFKDHLNESGSRLEGVFDFNRDPQALPRPVATIIFLQL